MQMDQMLISKESTNYLLKEGGANMHFAMRTKRPENAVSTKVEDVNREEEAKDSWKKCR